ncbi:hypothetical protein H5P28_11760 [Ruficoccus amylovorans]|uniref:XRE family transcriptional regulator n=1 Tax=Ruficoccus amylovorans TaxID=1804625 RepID=A0A842HEI8_9BACT|nr:hypothetical protein [Ruficoccus amylovorans]MBC2594933.1 hypothetical protein [Ruficoccus amylovorans]
MGKGFKDWEGVAAEIRKRAKVRYGYKSELARAVGVSPAHIQHYADGRKGSAGAVEPRWSVGVRIIRYLQDTE